MLSFLFSLTERNIIFLIIIIICLAFFLLFILLSFFLIVKTVIYLFDFIFNQVRKISSKWAWMYGTCPQVCLLYSLYCFHLMILQYKTIISTHFVTWKFRSQKMLLKISFNINLWRICNANCLLTVMKCQVALLAYFSVLLMESSPFMEKQTTSQEEKLKNSIFLQETGRTDKS